MLSHYRLDGKSKVSLQSFDPEDKHKFSDREEIADEFEKLKEELQEEQEKLFASKTNGVLILFQGMDCSGKDGVIKKVLSELNPQGFRAESFKTPTTEEAAHDFLWRTHKVVPSKGFITAFNRSYYEDVLITRVHKLVDEKEVEQRFKHIERFEKLLTDSGISIVKIFLHISPEFQLKKIQERMVNPEKLWKFDHSDLEERRYWNDYQEAYNDVFTKTSTKRNPWYIVPANHRWFRDYLVLRIIVSAFKELNLAYPSVDLSKYNSVLNDDPYVAVAAAAAENKEKKPIGNKNKN
ncbi:PPK2 family polyphosphate kinase [Gorillibacterium massiliense]|uniref:PPK2 family polyphosphate kinase n=1 Tax=Gorillibacterium massiliense TaxID=1280390 RepID=UPI0004B71FA9|nr:PPK2 family polyphosphate kinase [Gorillibacterium massiliense]